MSAWKGWKEQQKWTRLEANGKTTIGVLAGVSIQRDKRSRSYVFTVSYTPEGGTARRQSFPVRKAFGEWATRGDWIVEHHCTVRYDPADPWVAIVVEGSEHVWMDLPGASEWSRSA